MKLLLCGGGTAGHINPAVAIADALAQSDPCSKIAFTGRTGANEYKLVEDRSIPLYRIHVEGFDRNHLLKNARTLSVLAKSVFEAKKIIKEFSPDVIVGTGGYVCAPMMIAGHFMKIPTVLHESNAYPGLTTRLCAPMCDRILLNFEGCKEYLKNKSRVFTVGNPLLCDFGKISRADARKSLGIGKNDFFILSFGGSGGAEVINDNLIKLMKSYSVKNNFIRHTHAAGNKYYAEIKKNEPQLTRGLKGCKILPYIDNMPTVMNAADLVISRCGAMTLSEIAAVGVASILIPSPNVADDHQMKNARRFADDGCGILIEEGELNLRSLLDAVREFYHNEKRRISMAESARSHYNPSACQDILEQIYSLSREK